MANFSDLLPEIQMEIPEIPDFVAQRQMIRATREFCEETRAWRVSFDISTVADTATVDLSSSLPINTELVDIISMKNTDGGRPINPVTYAWLDKNTSDWRADTASDAKRFVLELNNTIRLYPTPSATTTDKYHVRVSVKPLLSTQTLDDRVVNKYGEALIHGTLARLYIIPRKPWTDERMAAIHDAQFRAKFPEARTEAAEEFQTGVPRSVKYGGL